MKCSAKGRSSSQVQESSHIATCSMGRQGCDSALHDLRGRQLSPLYMASQTRPWEAQALAF